MRIIVTGASGFIGSHLVQCLSAQGHEILGIDRTPSARLAPRMTFRAVDLLNRDLLAATFSDFRPEAMVHLAARTDLDEKHGMASYSANTQGVDNVVTAISATPGLRRAIYTSSQLVCRVGYIPRSDDDYQPSTLYGESKVQGERIVRAADGGGVEWCIVRPTLVWGPGMGMHYQRLFRMIGQGRYFHVGKKPLYKSYGYVGNVVHQYAKLVTANAGLIARRTFYLADYEPVSLREWADAFQRGLGAPPIRTMPEPLARAGAAVGDLVSKLGWPRFPYNSFRLRNVMTEYVFDLSETREVCGALPCSFEEGVDATVRWLHEQRIVPARASVSSASNG